jgi:hypothetical protein
MDPATMKCYIHPEYLGYLVINMTHFLALSVSNLSMSIPAIFSARLNSWAACCKFELSMSQIALAHSLSNPVNSTAKLLCCS